MMGLYLVMAWWEAVQEAWSRYVRSTYTSNDLHANVGTHAVSIFIGIFTVGIVFGRLRGHGAACRLCSLITVFGCELCWTTTTIPNCVSPDGHQVRFICIIRIIVQATWKRLSKITLLYWANINSLYGRIKWIQGRHGITA